MLEHSIIPGEFQARFVDSNDFRMMFECPEVDYFLDEWDDKDMGGLLFVKIREMLTHAPYKPETTEMKEFLALLSRLESETPGVYVCFS